MKTFFQSIAGYLPVQYHNATPIIIVAPVKAGKSNVLIAFADYVQQLEYQLGLSPVLWSTLVLVQYQRVVVEQKPTEPTPSMKTQEFEYVGFQLNGQAYVMIAVAGEDLIDEFGVDPTRIAALLRDAIVVFGFHPLLVFQDGAPTPAHFAVRSMAYLISHAFGLNAAESFKKALKLMLSFDLLSRFNEDFDRCQAVLEEARFDYEPTGTTPQTRFFLRNPGVEQGEIDVCDLAIAEVVKSVVGKSLPVQRQIEGALDKHPRVIRKLIRMDLLSLAPANGVYPDDLLRQRLGAAPDHLTVGGPDLRSRLQASRDELIVVEGPHTDGPTQLFKAIELMAKRNGSLMPRRRHQAKSSLIASAVAASLLILAAIAWGIGPVLTATGAASLAAGAGLAAWLGLRALPFTALRIRPSSRQAVKRPEPPIAPSSEAPAPPNVLHQHTPTGNGRFNHETAAR